MARDEYRVTVSISRDTITGDDSGGETATASTVATDLRPTKHYYSPKWERDEGTGAAGGAGTITVNRVFMKFTPPFPDLRVNDNLVESDGTTWAVLYVRSYARTMQADCELVD